VIEVREGAREVAGRNWSTINKSSSTDGSLGRSAISEACEGTCAENTHGSSQGNINDIISRSSSIGISSKI